MSVRLSDGRIACEFLVALRLASSFLTNLVGS
jgi:hypothetical protein